MSRELHDERISAYLDGELPAGERAEVEELLKTSSSHQQVLAELTSLRESLQALPHYTLGNDFAARVTSAAQLAAREREALAEVGPRKTNHTATHHVEVAAPALPQRRSSFAKWLVASAGGITVTAASIALVIYTFSGSDDVPKLTATGTNKENGKEPLIEEPTASEFVRAVSSTKDDEAVVVRVKLTKEAIRGKLLDNALAAHGIQMATADVNNEAARLTGLAYKEMLKSQAASPPAGRRAADVVFLEADVAQLEKALLDLEQNAVAKAAFAPESLVASTGKGPLTRPTTNAEPGSAGPETKIPTGGYYQHMPPHGFTLAPSASPPALKPGEKFPAKKSARVLIVVEVVD
ncbi:MAG: anti-sigma factor family protein [Pirellulaceae bacterium]